MAPQRLVRARFLRGPGSFGAEFLCVATDARPAGRRGRSFRSRAGRAGGPAGRSPPRQRPGTRPGSGPATAHWSRLRCPDLAAPAGAVGGGPAMMLGLPTSVRIWLATRATDLRKSFDTLAEVVRHQLQGDPLS